MKSSNCIVCKDLFYTYDCLRQKYCSRKCFGIDRRGIGYNTKHKLSKTRFWNIWCSIRRRCMNKNSSAYLKYGGKGINIDKKWLKFENFRDDMYESYLDHVSKFGEKETTIERIDFMGNYSPLNCKWATYKEQANNKKINYIIVNGEKVRKKDICKKLGITSGTLWARIKKYGQEYALNTPRRHWPNTDR